MALVGCNGGDLYVVFQLPTLRLRIATGLYTGHCSAFFWDKDRWTGFYLSTFEPFFWEGKKKPTKEEIEEFIRRKIELPNAPRKARKPRGK